MKDKLVNGTRIAGSSLGNCVTCSSLYVLSASGYAEISSCRNSHKFLVAFSSTSCGRESGSVSKGLPAKDERLEKINYKGGYYGFIAAIWSAVGGPLLVDVLFA